MGGSGISPRTVRGEKSRRRRQWWQKRRQENAALPREVWKKVKEHSKARGLFPRGVEMYMER